MGKVSILVDLDDIETEDLTAELAERGYSTFETSDGPDLGAVDTDALREELSYRGALDLERALEKPALLEWLRKANPPQEVRDAFWQSFGRIL